VAYPESGGRAQHPGKVLDTALEHAHRKTFLAVELSDQEDNLRERAARCETGTLQGAA